MQNILNYPFFYNLYQKLIGSNKYLEKLTNEFIKPYENCEIFEIGCATGNIIPYLQAHHKIHYTGDDISAKYIIFATKKYYKYTFLCQFLDHETKLRKNFDIIFMDGVLSENNDKCVINIFDFIKNHSNETTRIIISDTNYKNAQKIGVWDVIKRIYYSHKKNSYMRTKEEFISLMEKYFNIEKTTIINNPYYIPYEKIIFECTMIK